MKKCPCCGKEYPDNVSFCTVDQNPLESFDPVSIRETVQRMETCQGPSLIAICEIVSRVNEKCSDYAFGVDSAVRVKYRGREVCLVVGNVGTFAPPSESCACWTTRKVVYALAESQDQINWMAQNTDAFKPLRDNATFPVFWVKEQSLQEIARASCQGTDWLKMYYNVDNPNH